MTTVIQRSFASGEISPSLHARVDTARYAIGLKKLKNFQVMRHGGAENRAGFNFLHEAKVSASVSRLIPFIFNDTSTHVIELGHLYIRFIYNGVQVREADKTITNITQANPAVVTSAVHGYSNGDEVYISSVLGMTQVNGRNFKVAGVTANTFQLNYMDGSAVNSTAFGAYVSGGTAARVYTVASPYSSTDIFDINYLQSGDVLTLVHPSYPVYDLSRTSLLSWAITATSFAPSIAAPVGVAVSGIAGTVAYWRVTTIKQETFEESLVSSAVGASADATAGTPRTITWTAVTGAQEYNIYKGYNGTAGSFGFIATSTTNSFLDSGVVPDFSETPPIARDPFNATGEYPSCGTYYQQRKIFAGSNNKPDTIFCSKTSFFNNYTVSSPLQDDDAVTFKTSGKQVNRVKHLLDIGKLISLTTGGEWVIEGDSSGVIRPTDINPRQYSYNGSGNLPPIVAGSTALYVQNRGTVIRDLTFDFQVDGYTGNDLTISSSHLFDGYTLVDWAYQKIPHSIVWVVRDDGILLGLTYVREQQMLAWHQHDTDGFFESVCCIPEGDEDSLYAIVRRNVDGTDLRYIEKLNTRRVDNVIDSVFMDSALAYDGENTSGSNTITISGGTSWVALEFVTMTSIADTFFAYNIGDQLFFTSNDGIKIRITITAYTSAKIVTGQLQRDLPVELRNTATLIWSLAIKDVGGLWHLEGKGVSVLSDGFVQGSPNNDAYSVSTVQDGTISLQTPSAKIKVGLPYVSDIATLGIDNPQGATIIHKKKNIGAINVYMEATRGGWYGSIEPDGDDELEDLYELKNRNEENYDDPVNLYSGIDKVEIKGQWTSEGEVFIRQVDPLPITILAIAPSGFIPFE